VTGWQVVHGDCIEVMAGMPEARARIAADFPLGRAA
jgi:hypothetical protein